MVSIKEIKKLNGLSKSEKIEFYENILNLVEVGNTTIYEYKELFGFDDVSDKHILNEIQKALNELIHNYRKLFKQEENTPEFKNKVITSQKLIQKECKRILTYYPSLNNLATSIGYIDKITKETVMKEITPEDIKAALFYLYQKNEYVSAITVKNVAYLMLTGKECKEKLYNGYNNLGKEEKLLLQNRKKNISNGPSDFKRIITEIDTSSKDLFLIKQQSKIIRR